MVGGFGTSLIPKKLNKRLVFCRNCEVDGVPLDLAVETPPSTLASS